MKLERCLDEYVNRYVDVAMWMYLHKLCNSSASCWQMKLLIIF